MVDKSIRQNAGRDLNAAIDSFNGNVVEIGSSGKEELEAKLGDFLEAIVSSSLSDTDKTTILTEAQTVAREAAANGKLVGRAQLLWTGIKEVISNVPKAVTAWESLSKLWSELPK